MNRDSTGLPAARLLALHEDVLPTQSLLEADVYTLGRSPLCQIVVQRSIVSRLHAKIEREGPRYQLVDAGSANGTFLNGKRRLAPHVLSDRDLFQFAGEVCTRESCAATVWGHDYDPGLDADALDRAFSSLAPNCAVSIPMPT